MMRATNPRSEHNWQDLINRNEKLAIEVGRLRGECTMLKRKNSSLLASKLNLLAEKKIEMTKEFKNNSTQTEEYWICTLDYFHSPRTLFPEEDLAEVQEAVEGNLITPISTPNKKGVFVTSSGKSGTPSPTVERVGKVLTDRIVSEKLDLSMSTPCRNEEMFTGNRPLRSVKKPVSYKEPSLIVKVRKGFQFFKFDGTPQHY